MLAHFILQILETVQINLFVSFSLLHENNSMSFGIKLYRASGFCFLHY